jgi:hypothetical protein
MELNSFNLAFDVKMDLKCEICGEAHSHSDIVQLPEKHV